MIFFPTLRRARLRNDVIAALSLAALAIPEQLATARLAGVPEPQGIAVFAAAAAAGALIARHRTLSIGADSTIAPIIAAALATGAATGTGALVAALVGVILCAAAALRLEWIARLMSNPVATGMMAGISLHILVGRLPAALGLDLPVGSLVQTLSDVATGLPSARPEPLAMTVLVVVICYIGRAIDRRLPAALFGLAVTAVLAALADPAGTLVPRVPGNGLTWGLALPSLAPDTLLAVLPAALTISFLCLFQTTVVLRQIGNDTPALRRNSLAAVGLGNLASAAIGGFAVNTSPPRTEILRQSRATSQWASLGAAVVGLAILMTAPGILTVLPVSGLAGILVFIGMHIFPARQFAQLLRSSPAEAGIAWATTALVTFVPLQTGLPLAMLLSLVLATLPLFVSQVSELRQVPGTTIWWRFEDETGMRATPDVLVLGLTAPVNFANAEGIVADIRAKVGRRRHRPRLLVLECAGVLSVDATGAEMLAALVREFTAGRIDVALARVESGRAARDIRRSDLDGALGPGRMFESVEQAIQSLAPDRP